MRVINMAHGEFIMMGAYSGYVVQLFVTNYTLSIVIAIPVAFLVTFFAGIVMERLVIKKLYFRIYNTVITLLDFTTKRWSNQGYLYRQKVILNQLTLITYLKSR